MYRLGITGAWQASNVFTGLPAGIHEFFVQNSDGTCGVGPLVDTLVNPIPFSCPIVPPANPDSICSSDVFVVFSVPALPDASGYFWDVDSSVIIVTGQGTNSVTLNMNDAPIGSYDICAATLSNCGNSGPCCFTYTVISCEEICGNGLDDDNNG